MNSKLRGCGVFVLTKSHISVSVTEHTHKQEVSAMVSSMRPWNGRVCLVPEPIIELAEIRPGITCNLRSSQRQESPYLLPGDSEKTRLAKIERLLNSGHLDLCHDDLIGFMRQVRPGTMLAMFIQSFNGDTATLVVKIREVTFRGSCLNPLLDFPRPRLWQKMFGRTTNIWGSFVLAAAVAPHHVKRPLAIIDDDGSEFVKLFS